ncbi:hypothetical protein Bca101_051022 [Brassica carinata]
MSERNYVSWNSMIASFARHERWFVVSTLWVWEAREARDEISKLIRWKLDGNTSSDETRVSVVLLSKRRRSSRGGRDEMVKIQTRVRPP